MNLKWYFKISKCMLFFLILIIIGSNITAQRLADITEAKINKPFICKELTADVVKLELLGTDLNYSSSGLKEKGLSAKASIQNAFVTVKCNLVPRIEYINSLWSEGTAQLKSDVQNMID